MFVVLTSLIPGVVGLLLVGLAVAFERGVLGDGLRSCRH